MWWILLLVVLMSYVVYASEECAAEYAKALDCYECSTYSNEPYCADPFNATHPDLKSIQCHEACAKWVRIPSPGVVHYIRTCSTNIDIRMSIALVCMTESRPGDGHLCFCRKSRCNGSNSIHPPSKNLPWLLLLSLLITVLLAHSYLPGYTQTCDATLWIVSMLLYGGVLCSCFNTLQYLTGVVAHLYTRRHHPPIG